MGAQQAKPRPRAARREKHTAGVIPQGAQMELREQPAPLAKSREGREPRNDREELGVVLGSAAAVAEQHKESHAMPEGVTAASERNPPHRTLCFLLFCAP